MKKGIALFSTLIILVLVIMLMSMALKNSTNIKQSQTFVKDMIQENLILNDIKTLLDDKIFAKYRAKSQQERVLLLKELTKSPMTFKNRVDNSTITVKLQSSSDKINLNTLMAFKYREFRRNFFNKLEIIDTALLEDIIKANLNKAGKNERLVSNEDYKLAFKEVDFYEGEIKSFEEFYKIFDIYVKQSDDIKAKKIVWEKYLKFSSSEDLDLNYMPLELIDALPVYFNSDIREKLKEKEELVTNKSELKVDDAKLTPLKVDIETKELLCKINIKSINYEVQFSFYYIINGKKASNLRMERWNY